MASYKKKPNFFETEEGEAFKQSLREMVSSRVYNTDSSFSANSTLHPDHKISFVDKHMDYIRSHPTTNPEHYLSNLRLMTRIR